MATLNPWHGLRGLPRESWMLALATWVNRAGTMVLPFLVLHLTKNLGFSPARAGSVLALYGVVSLCVAPVAGRLGDRIGMLRLITFSLFGSALALCLLPSARTYAQVAVRVALLAIFSEAVRPATLALAGSFAGAELRRQGFALNRMAVNLGMSIGPALGGFLATVSFEALFWVDGATSAVAGLLFVILPFRAVHPPEPQQVKLPALESSGRGQLLFVLLALLPVSMVFFQLEGAYPLFLVRELHFSEATFGALFTLNTVLILLFEVGLNVVTQHWRTQRVMALGAVLTGIGFGALIALHSLGGVIFTVIVWTVGEMLLFPATAAYVSDLAPRGRQGEYMGYYAMTFGLGLSLGPWAGTAILGRWGFSAVWGVCLAIGLLSGGLMLRVNRYPAPDSAGS